MKILRRVLLIGLCLHVGQAWAGDVAVYSINPRWDSAFQTLYVTTSFTLECCEGGAQPASLDLYSFVDRKSGVVGLEFPPGADLLSERGIQLFEDKVKNLFDKIASHSEPLIAFKIAKKAEKKILEDCSNRYFNTQVAKLVQPWKETCETDLGQGLTLQCRNSFHELGRKRSVECSVKDQHATLLTVKQNGAAGLFGLQLFQIPNSQNWVGYFTFSDPFHTPVLGPHTLVVTGFAVVEENGQLPVAINPEIKNNLEAFRRLWKHLDKINALFYWP